MQLHSISPCPATGDQGDEITTFHLLLSRRKVTIPLLQAEQAQQLQQLLLSLALNTFLRFGPTSDTL